LDKKEIAELLESLCERPFAGESPFAGQSPFAGREGPPPADAAAASRIAQALSNPDAEQPEAQSSSPPGAALAAILSGTATEAQCGAFRAVAATSGAARLDAQSALAFVDSIEQAPLAAPAHLVEQAVAFTGTTRSRPGIWSSLWSSLSGNLIGRPGGRVVAACAVMLMAGGAAWSLLGPANVGSGSVAPVSTAPEEVQPVSAGGAPSAGPPVVAPPAPAPLPVEPDPVVPMLGVRRPAAPAAPTAAAVQEALTDPCSPRLAAKSEAQASSDVRFRVTKPEPKRPPKTADLATPDPGCSADPAGRVVVNPAAGADNPRGDRGPVRADRPAARVGRSDHVPAAASAPAARPASPAVRPSVVPAAR
jgi:hypothetical protein